MTSAAAPSETLPKKAGRRTLFRLLAVAIGLSIFPLVEGICWLIGAGEPDTRDDPFVGFSDLQPLFVHDADSNEFRIPESRRRFFAIDSFPAEKSANTTRVFCLGGSTVQGRPFSKETSFTTWLRLALEAAEPDRNWEVVNCGGISYASYRLVPILEECLQYEPDLFIICTGHNEFLEDRTYGNVRDATPLVSVPHQWLARTRSYHIYRDALLSLTGDNREQPKTIMANDVDALLDYHNGLQAFHRDESWRNGVIQHFAFNIDRMLSIAGDAGVPVILVRPPSNLGDTPPFKSEHRADLSDSEQAEWDALIAQFRTEMGVDPTQALTTLDAALAIDDQYAATHFWRGRELEELGRFDEAHAAFVRARDEDICPLRILTPMERSLAAAAKRSGTPLLDAHQLLEKETRNGILDNSKLVDHVHPTFGGHRRIALALLKLMQDAALVQPEGNWQAAAERAFNDHFDFLPQIYFLRGEQNLEGLRYWSQGLADGPPIETRFPERVQ